VIVTALKWGREFAIVWASLLVIVPVFSNFGGGRNA
jgi:hypothetical protein